MTIPFVDLKAQYHSIRDEIDSAIQEVIENTAFIKGHYVDKFEADYSSFMEGSEVVGCANGTDAIELALKALDIGPGMEVIVPANTWISTGEAVTTNGAQVVFVDSDPDYYTINPALIEEKITDRTKAIIPVHLYGQPAEMDTILAIAKKYNLFVIEDCAQAHGARYKGRLIGTLGDIATFSFFPGKNLGAYGDAGGVVTRNSTLAERIRMLANHGRLGKFDHALEGRNSRLDGIQAAILSAKLPHLPAWTTARQKNAALYCEYLKDGAAELPKNRPDSEHAYHLFVIRVGNREDLQEKLKEEGIASGIHYPIPLPLLKAYSRMGHIASDFPVCSSQMGEILSLPLYPELSETQIKRVCEIVNKYALKPRSGVQERVAV